MRLAYIPPTYGFATIGGIPLHTPAWNCINTYLLMDRSPIRRKNKLRPGVPGVRGKRGFPEEIVVELEVGIIGDYDINGDPTADAKVAEEEHYIYLVEALRYGATDSEDALDAVVTSAIPGVTYEGKVQIGRIYRKPIQGTSCCFIEVGLIHGELEILGT